MSSSTEMTSITSADGRLQPAKQRVPIFASLVFLLIIGSIALFSATSYRSEVQHDDVWQMWAGQFRGYTLGLLFFMIGYFVSPRRWLTSGASVSLAVVLVLLLLGTAFSPMGIERNDAQRWLKIGSLVFQPSELAKFVLPVLLIYLTGPWKFQGNPLNPPSNTPRYILSVGLIFFPLFLILIQPDLGTTVVVGGLCLIPISRSRRLLRMLYKGAVGLMAFLLLTQGYRFPEFAERFRAIWDPQSVDQVWAGFQSIGSGGLFGRGLGEGAGKLGYLPSAYNDFIFAVYAEETGFVGVTVVVVLFGTLLWCGRKLWQSLEDDDLSLLAMVLTLAITGQAALNIMVNLALLPTKGIALPFFSHGSTGLAVFMGMSGVLLALTRCRGKEVLPA